MSNSSTSASCPSCQAKLPPASQFCPQCGTRQAIGETLEMSPGPVFADPNVAARPVPEYSPPAMHRAHRRPFGAHPVPLLGGLGSLTLLLAIILLADGSTVTGLLLLAVSIALLTLFIGGTRREPHAPAAPPTLRAITRLRSLAGLAAVSVRAWTRGGIELLRLRHRQQQLRTELKASLTPLGEAIHQDDQQRAEALKHRAAELEQKIDATERQALAAIAAARQEIEQERMTIQPTQAFSPSEADEQATTAHGPPRVL